MYRDKYVERCKNDRECFRWSYLTPIDTTLNATLTLKELLTALLSKHAERINEHFQTATHLCDIARLPYTYIAGTYI